VIGIAGGSASGKASLTAYHGRVEEPRSRCRADVRCALNPVRTGPYSDRLDPRAGLLL
jgi:hypothetical protein